MEQAMKRKMIYGNTTIEYEVYFSTRKTLGITVMPDGNVIVKAPEKVEMELVEDKIYKRASWIIRQQEIFRSFGEKPYCRRSGKSTVPACLCTGWCFALLSVPWRRMRGL